MDKLIKISEEQLINFEVIKTGITISVTNNNIETDFNLIGIEIIPHFIVIKPNNIRNSIIDKEQAEGGIDDIDRNTNEGKYFINIRNYSHEEIQHLSSFVTEEILKEIWTILTVRNDAQTTLSIKNEKIREILIQENSDIFKSENDLEEFCDKYNLKIEDFIKPAVFSELDMKLKEVEARFDLEQFFARRYLFCSTLIYKLKNRLNEFIMNGNNIESKKLIVVSQWIEKMNQKLETLKTYTDFYKLYDTPMSDKRIEIKNSNNININNGIISESKFSQEVNKKPDTESKFSKRIAIWTIVIAAIGVLVSMIFG